jgi:hypothetical protein
MEQAVSICREFPSMTNIVGICGDHSHCLYSAKANKFCKKQKIKTQFIGFLL